MLARAIEARKRCSEWFARQGTPPKHETKESYPASNEQHVFFIQVLEQILETLFPRSQQSAQSDEPNTLTNRFGSLQIEDADEVEDDELFSTDQKIALEQSSKQSG